MHPMACNDRSCTTTEGLQRPMQRILLKTTIPFTEDDWHVGRFSLLQQRLFTRSDTSISARPLYSVMVPLYTDRGQEASLPWCRCPGVLPICEDRRMRLASPDRRMTPKSPATVERAPANETPEPRAKQRGGIIPLITLWASASPIWEMWALDRTWRFICGKGTCPRDD